MSDRPIAGFECALFYKDGANWNEIKNAKDVSLPDSTEAIDVSARYSAAKKYIAGMSDGSIEFGYQYIKGTDPVFDALQTHYLSREPIEIAAAIRAGKSRFDISLDPAELGRIDVRINVDRNGQVTSHLTVEKPETLQMLRQDAPQLQRALDDAGFKTGSNGLSFSLRDQNSSGQNSGQNNDNGGNARRLIISEDDTVAAAPVGRGYGRMLGSSSGVDIRV